MFLWNNHVVCVNDSLGLYLFASSVKDVKFIDEGEHSS
jgi:hypothetical protein